METLVEQQADVPMVTLDMVMVTLCDADPEKVTLAFWPTAEVVILTAGPPTDAVAVTSLDRLMVADPVAVPEGSTSVV